MPRLKWSDSSKWRNLKKCPSTWRGIRYRFVVIDVCKLQVAIDTRHFVDRPASRNQVDTQTDMSHKDDRSHKDAQTDISHKSPSNHATWSDKSIPIPIPIPAYYGYGCGLVGWCILDADDDACCMCRVKLMLVDACWRVKHATWAKSSCK